MLQGVFIPYAVFVEYEDLTVVGVTEHQLLVENVWHEHQVVLNVLLGVDLLQVPDVDDVARGAAEQEGLVEDDLLSVREQLGMPREVLQLHPAPRQVGEGDEGEEVVNKASSIL